MEPTGAEFRKFAARRVGLAEPVLTPTDDPAVGTDRAGVFAPGLNLREATAGRIRFAVFVVTPARDLAISIKRTGEVSAGECSAGADLSERTARWTASFRASFAGKCAVRLQAADVNPSRADLSECSARRAATGATPSAPTFNGPVGAQPAAVIAVHTDLCEGAAGWGRLPKSVVTPADDLLIAAQTTTVLATCADLGERPAGRFGLAR